MKIIRDIDTFSTLSGEATIVTVGSFDGVHSGHSSLLKGLRRRASQESLRSVVVSFSPHPRVTLGRSEGLQLLSSDKEKATLLSDEGIDTLLLLEFDKALSALSYEEFIEEYLIKKVGMQELVIGFNHHMGHNGGSSESLVQCAKKHNFRTTIESEHSPTGEKISSTTIREHLSHGDISLANKLLGHPYLMIGRSDEQGVVQFEEPLKLIPAPGRYIADINGTEQGITIDVQQHVRCEEKNKEVKIKILSRDEE